VERHISKGGDGCPRCGTGTLNEKRGIEVAMCSNWDKIQREARRTVQDSEGKERPAIMGCYGIGVTRTYKRSSSSALMPWNHLAHLDSP